MKNTVRLVFIILIVSIGCTRKEQERTATISVTLPEAVKSAANSSKLFDNILFQSTTNSVSTLNETPNWGITDPASTSEIGCYAIFVGGNEADHNSGMCLVGKDTTAAKKINFGPYFGLFPAGASIELDIKAGSRTIHLLGMKKGSQPCQALSFGNNSQMNFSNYSNPLLLASTQTDIKLGINSLSLTSQLTNLEGQKVAYCNVMDDGQTMPATTFQITGHNRFGPDTCNKQMVQLGSSAGSNLRVFNDQDQIITFNPTAASPSQIFSDHNCQNQITNIIIPKGNIRGEFFFKSNETVNVSESYRIMNFSSTNLGTSTKGYFLKSSTATQTMAQFQFLNDGNFIKGGECRNADFFVLDQEGYSMKAAAAITVAADIKTIDGSAVYSGAVNFVNNCEEKTSLSKNYPAPIAASMSIGRLFIHAHDVNSFPANFRLNLLLSTFNNYSLWNVTQTINNIGLSFRVNGGAYTAAVPSPLFASDCLTIKATAQDANGNVLSPSGFTSYNLNFEGIMGAEIFKTPSCTGSPDFDNRYVLAAGIFESSIRLNNVNTINPVNLKARSMFAVNQAEVTKPISVLWDPGALQNHKPNLFWYKDFTAGSWLNLVFPGVSSIPLSVSGISGLVAGGDNEIDITSLSQNFNRSIATPNGHQSFSMMLKINSFASTQEIFKFSNSTPNIKSLKILNSSGYRFALNDSYSTTHYHTSTVNTNQWYVITFVNEQSGPNHTTKVYLDNQNIPIFSVLTTSQTFLPNYLYFNQDGTNSINGKIKADILLSYSPLSTTDVNSIYYYFKNKYPSAGLP